MEGDFSFSADDWAKMWKEGNTCCHINTLSGLFVKHKDELIAGRQNVKVFVPLCGKAVEMRWFYDNGHEVVGVECGEDAIQQFFEENKIDHIVEDIPEIKGKRYKSQDGKVRLYCCDLYLFGPSVESGFGAVWDSGALNAVNKEDQEKYVAVVKAVMGNNCTNLTVLDEVVDWEIAADHEKLKTLFGEGFKVESRDYLPANEQLKSMQIAAQYLYSICKL